MNNVITFEQAIKMTTLFRKQKEIIVNSDLQGQNILPLSESFSRQAFDKMLAQTGCIGLRVYYGMSEDLKVRLIIVGVNEKNEDMLPKSSASVESSVFLGTTLNNTTDENEEENDDDDEVIIEEGVMCPPICPPPSLLNP